MDSIGKSTSRIGRAFNAERAGDSLHQAVDQLSQAAGPAVSRVASGAHQLVDRVAGSGSRVAHQLQETGTRLKNAEQRLVGASSAYVREHPLRSVGIALAAGFLVSRLVIARKAPGSGEESAEGAEGAEGG